MLNWLDGRNSSSFENIVWEKNQLSFSIMRSISANNLKAMLPIHTETGKLVSIARDGQPLPFSTQTIKGIDYAFFAAAPGTVSYTASYQPSSVEKTPSIKNHQKSPREKSKDSTGGRPFYVNVMPNPGLSYFNVVMNSSDAEPATVKVSDVSGRILESYDKITSTGILRIGQKWRSGTYFVDVMQGRKSKVIKVIKVN
jgi:hypothetical protein